MEFNRVNGEKIASATHSSNVQCFTPIIMHIHTYTVGNLALSRAIGDFNFKCNPDLPQAEQIVTGQLNTAIRGVIMMGHLL